jgi:hypothetical protein
MKKIEYKAPEMEVIKMMSKVNLLAGSDPGEGPGGSGDDD